MHHSPALHAAPAAATTYVGSTGCIGDCFIFKMNMLYQLLFFLSRIGLYANNREHILYKYYIVHKVIVYNCSVLVDTTILVLQEKESTHSVFLLGPVSDQWQCLRFNGTRDE